MRWIIIFLFASFTAQSTHSNSIDWQEWSADIFDKAQAESKLVYLHIGANWCHWCHVMEQETYAEDTVQSYLASNYISVFADQDKNAALGNRYRAYGWPALIIFNAQGEEVNKIAGYRDVSTFLNILKNAVDNPEPLRGRRRDVPAGQSVSELWNERFYQSLDVEVGGYRGPQKFVDEATFDWAFLNRSNDEASQWLENSISGSLNLLDSEWGGMYQYSVHYRWTAPHYEKLVTKQARYIRLYSKWFAESGDSTYLEAAISIYQYVTNMQKQGDIYLTAQDADIVQGEKAHSYFDMDSTSRYSLGIPRIDSNMYPVQNGDMIEALVHLWAATGDERYLEDAERCYAAWRLMVNEEGLYVRGEDATVLLIDQLAMMGGVRMLWQATQRSEYKLRLLELTDEVVQVFFSGDRFNPWIGELGLEPEYDLELQLRTIRAISQIQTSLRVQTWNDRVQSAWNTASERKWLEQYYAMPEWKLAEHFLEVEKAEVVISGSDEELEVLRRRALLLPDQNYLIRIASEGESEDAQYLAQAGLYFCRGGRCQFPIFL